MTRLQPKPLIGFICNPFGRFAKALEYRDGEVFVLGRRPRNIDLRDIASAPLVTRGFGGRDLTIQCEDGSRTLLKGASPEKARVFARAIETDWITHITQRFEASRREIDAVLDAITELAAPTRYPSACLVSPHLEAARRLEESLLARVPTAALSEDANRQIEAIGGFLRDVGKVRDQAISIFETQQLRAWGDFFDTFESNPLTPEQRTAIIADEDATLVLAGAGSGKTSVITAKAGYLIKTNTRAPDEILLLAFAKDAAKEMSERIELRCGEPLEARTFHALAYDIIGIVEGSKPALANHATDDKAYLALIKDILITLVRTATEVSRAIIGWFSYARLDAKSEWDFKKKHDYYKHLEKLDLRTLQGEQVKSLEELMIKPPRVYRRLITPFHATLSNSLHCS